MHWHEWRGSLDGRPTMWIRRLLAFRGCRLDLHKMVGADDAECFHTHPARAVRLVLWGGYVEQTWEGRWRFWFPGRVGIVRPDLCHRIAGLRNGRVSYSLWLRFPKCARVDLRGTGWDDQRAAMAARQQGAAVGGRGSLSRQPDRGRLYPQQGG